MAPFFTRASSKGDQFGEELLLELEALNHALESRSHTRIRNLTSFAISPRCASEPKFSLKGPLHPKPSFKVPFRSTSTSCDRSGKAKSSNLVKESHHHHQHPNSRKQAAACKQAEKSHFHRVQNLDHSKDHRDGSRLQTNGEGVSQTEKHQNKKKGFKLDQILQRKSIWNWRLLRSFSHMLLGSRYRPHVLFSLQVCRIESLPASMNGNRLTVLWTCKNSSLQTTPSKVVDGTAVFGESLQYQCVISSIRRANNASRHDNEPSVLSVMATDLYDLELSKHYMNLSSLLPADDRNGALFSDSFHEARFELSDTVKGGILIVKVHYNVLQKRPLKAKSGMRSTVNKSFYLTKSLSVLQGSSSLIESKASSFSCLAEPDAAVARCYSTGHLDNKKWTALQASEARSDDFSDSFEFKVPFKGSHAIDFSFSRVQSAATNDGSLYDEGSPCFTHTSDAYDKFLQEENRDFGDNDLSQQPKLQNPCSIENQASSGSLSFEAARHLRRLATDSDDDLDSVAEEFLNMLDMGFDSGHHNSEDDLESPREQLLKKCGADLIRLNIM